MEEPRSELKADAEEPDFDALTPPITGPIVSPAILAGAFIAFVVSFGEFTATQFLISPGTSTVPVAIYTMLRTGLTPTINALSVVLIVIMLVVALSRRKLSSS